MVWLNDVAAKGVVRGVSFVFEDNLAVCVEYDCLQIKCCAWDTEMHDGLLRSPEDVVCCCRNVLMRLRSATGAVFHDPDGPQLWSMW